MKKFLNSIIFVLLIFVAVFSVSACGKKPPETPPGVTDPSDPGQTPPTDPTDPNNPVVPENFVVKIDGDTVYFGQYATTIKAQDVTISGEADENGFYMGSDKNKYVRVQSTLDGVYRYSIKKFSDGTTLEINEPFDLYFRVEPIKWKILKQEGNKALILCTSIIDNSAFQPLSNIKKNSDNQIWYINTESQNMPETFKTYLNTLDEQDGTKDISQVRADDWEYSYMRYYLNKYFYNTAFTDLQKALVIESEVDNSINTTETSSVDADYRDDYVYSNTTDKVFLLSYQDFINSDYGFNSSPEADESRQFKNTDYAIAKGSYNYEGAYGYFWTRSRGIVNYNNSRCSAWCFRNDGRYGSAQQVTGKDQSGILPALWIDLSDAEA